MANNDHFELPKSIEAEQAVLGTILLEQDSFETVAGLIRGDEYYSEAHVLIFRAMADLRDAGEPIDLLTVTNRLQAIDRLEDVGNVSYLTQLVDGVPSTGNVANYAEIIQDKFILRSGITELQRRLEEAKQSGDPMAVLASLQEAGNTLMDRAVKTQDFHWIREVVRDAFDDIESRYAHKSESGVTGIPSGFRDLDAMTSGFQKSDSIIVAARPSVGKTAFALNIAQNVGIREGETVAIFSLEMGAKQLVQRMLSAEGHIDASRLRTGFLENDDWEKMTGAIGQLAEANIFIDDSPVLTVYDIRAKCRRLKKEHGLGMILIDYLQLISGSGRRDNRQQEVSDISRTLKQIARELEVPVIALSQLSRNVEQRQDKRPMLSDLRESGAIEQDADIVAFLYRDDYYDKESEKKNIIEIIIAKQRNGPVGTVELAFMKNYNKFVNLDRSHQSIEAAGKPIPDMYRRTQ